MIGEILHKRGKNCLVKEGVEGDSYINGEGWSCSIKEEKGLALQKGREGGGAE